MFEHEHHKKMTTSEIAAMLSTMLYHRRFFPYYVYNLIAGLDEEGISFMNWELPKTSWSVHSSVGKSQYDTFELKGL